MDDSDQSDECDRGGKEIPLVLDRKFVDMLLDDLQTLFYVSYHTTSSYRLRSREYHISRLPKTALEKDTKKPLGKHCLPSGQKKNCQSFRSEVGPNPENYTAP